MEIRQLQSFRAVVREGSFTAAARTLHLTQPAVSLHVKGLEKEIGSRLMERDARGVRLTPAGHVLLEAAEVVLGATEDATRRIRVLAAPERGALSLACGDTVALNLLPPILGAFRRLRPLAEVVVHNHGTRRILQMVLRREADLGVVTRPAWLDPALWARTLMVESFFLALPRDHPQAEGEQVPLARMDGEHAVLLAKPSETRGLIDRGLADLGISASVVMESGNLEVVKAYVADGLGFSILPEMAIRAEDRERLKILPIEDAFPKRALAITRRKDRLPSLLAADVLQLLADRFGDPSSDL